MLSFFQDVRFALRQLRRSPGFAVVAIVTLALGIGANTAIFLLTYSIVLRSLPVPHPGQLIRIGSWASADHDLPLSYPEYGALRTHQTAVSGLFAWSDNTAALEENGQTRSANIAMATGGLFRVLEVQPFLGRALDAEAGERGQPFKAEGLLSYDYWRAHYNGDRGVLGRAIKVDKTNVIVIGVMPPGFTGLSPENHFDLLLPLSFQRITQPKFSMIDQPGAFWLTVMARLKPGQTPASAQASLDAQRQMVLNEADPAHHVLNDNLFGGGLKFVALPGRAGHSWLRSQYETPLLALEALCALMMLLCAANTALLILSRVSGRLHEFAVRSALGAARARLLAQVLIETALLTSAGLLAGGFVGWELAHALVAMIAPAREPISLSLKMGPAIVLFALGLSLAAALLAGVWPAWRASRSAPALDLRPLHTQKSAARLGRWIIPTQVALGIVLIYAAVLLSATLRSYLKEQSGFAPSHVTIADLNYPDNDPESPEMVRRSLQLAQQVAAAPGVQAAALLNMPPLQGWSNTADFFTRDAHGAIHHDASEWPQSVTPGYFAAIGTAIVEGRAFTQADIAGDKVCVISRAAADFFFPGEDPVGRFIGEGDGTPPAPNAKNQASTYRIVGVTEDAHMQSLLTPAPMMIYRLYEQEKHPFADGFIVVRAASSSLAADAVRRAATQILPGAEAPRIYTFDAAVDQDLSRQRLLSSVSGGFAILALALVAIGLYGILARTVTERRREIGIRMALGARRQQIVSTLARTAALRIAIGVVAGTALAAGVGRMLQSLLFGVTAGSPVVALATLVLLLAVLALAFVFPAGRAASVDPMEAIRDE
jgi:predicted permease